MWEWVDHLGALLIDAGVAALVLWALASLAMLGCRQPARRLRIAHAAAVGSLACLPLIGFDLVPRYDMVPVFQETWGFSTLATPEAGGDLVWFARVLILGYAVALIGGLGWLALGYVGLSRLIGSSSPSSPETRALLESLPFPDRRRRPGVRVTARVRRPVLVGLVRPLILVPPALEQPRARDRLRLSLLHELAHAEARDTWSGFLGHLAGAFWFFAPPFWWVAAQARLDQEFLADRRAAEHYGPTPAYASSLLDLASSRVERAWQVAVGKDLARPNADGSPLFQRLLMLVRCPFPVEPCPPVWWTRGLPGLAVLITLAVSTLTVRKAAPIADDRPRGATFRMSRLEIPPAMPDPEGRCPAVELPISLPDRFHLTLEVWGNPSGLARLRVAGLPIVLPIPRRPLDPRRELAGWHRLELDRVPRGTHLRVDGAAVPLRSNLVRLTRWLSIEPSPGKATAFRNLTLTW